MALVRIERVEETLEFGVVGHFAGPGRLGKLMTREIILVCHMHMVDINLLELLEIDIAGALLAIAIDEAFSLDAFSLKSGGLVDLI